MPRTFQKIAFILSTLFAAGLITTACVSTYNTISNREFTNQYNPDAQAMDIMYQVYMKSPQEYRLYFKFFPRQLTFRQFDEDSTQMAAARLFYRITPNYSSINILDSLSQNFYFKTYAGNQYMGYIPLNVYQTGNYVIEVFFTDLISETSVNQVIDLKITNEAGPKSLFYTSQYGSPKFNPYAREQDTFRLRSHYYQNTPLKAKFYKSADALPLPPDVTKVIPYKTPALDTSFNIAQMDTTLLHFNSTGIFYATPDNSDKGKTLGIFQIHYPYVKTAEELLKPMAYLCGENEMSAYWKMEDLKHAVDSFWLRSAGDMEKARELIRIYYNRVQMANYYFADYREGWQSDRGMIYTICGLPENIKKSELEETWIYGKGEELQFTFYKEQHPKFGLTYELHRSEKYSRIWSNAIRNWRDGKAFSLNPL